MAQKKRIQDITIITDAAFEMLNEKGIEDFSIRNLAKHLNVGTMTLYNYVKNREEIIENVIAKTYKLIADKIDNQLIDIAKTLPDQRYVYRTFSDNIYAMAVDYPVATELMIDSMLHTFITDGFVPEIVDAIQSHKENYPFTFNPNDFLNERFIYLNAIIGIVKSKLIGKKEMGKEQFNDLSTFAWKRLFQIEEADL